MARISRDDLYMGLAQEFALRSTCLRGHVGCVIVRDNHLIGGGYNGAPPHMPHCEEIGCETEGDVDPGCKRAIHAELNAVAFSARFGVSTDEGTVYCTHATCRACAQALASAGIVEFHYEVPYRDEAGLNLLNEAGIEVFRYGRS